MIDQCKQVLNSHYSIYPREVTVNSLLTTTTTSMTAPLPVAREERCRLGATLFAKHWTDVVQDVLGRGD